VLGISVDPVGDTPDRARSFLRHNGLTGGRVRFLLGTRAELAPVWARFGIIPIGASKHEATAAAAAYDKLRAGGRKEEFEEYEHEYEEYKPGGEEAGEHVPDAAKEAFPSGSDGQYRGLARHEQDFDHTAYVMVIDRRGRQRVGFPFETLDPTRLEQDLRRLLDEA
jgi:cytochrome oxidase Cu insertion factor (SCO1/SenC/PrrC family)